MQTLKPSILPDNRKFVLYPLFAGLIVTGIGLLIGHVIMIVLPLIILAVFPGLPILFHLIFHLFVRIHIDVDRLVVRDYVGNRFVKYRSYQQICFGDIAYIYYLEKEINLLLTLRTVLKKFKIPAKEMDYTKRHLMERYGIPEGRFHAFERGSQKILTDYTATSVLMKLDEIYETYRIPKETRKEIKKGLKDDGNFNFEYLQDKLIEYPVGWQDLEDLRDEFAHIDTDTLSPFLLTKVRMARYQKAQRQRHGGGTLRLNTGLVLANEDGTQKVYLMHFHDLSEKDVLTLMQIIQNNNPEITYLMTKKERGRLRLNNSR